jgi:peptidoglycan DL-endopeptidase CwlO
MTAPAPDSAPIRRAGSAIRSKPVLSGVAITLFVAGAVLMTAGYLHVPPADVLRALIKGDPLPRNTAFPARALQRIDELGPAGAGSELGRDVAASALHYAEVAVPYVWAGETPDGWDCSGFVTWVLHHDHNIELPDNDHTTAMGFLVWSGARQVVRSECAPGDLLCWGSHVAIAVSNSEMVHAPGRGQVTKRAKIWRFPAPAVRRPNAYGG